MSSNDNQSPNKTTGQLHSLKGIAVEGVGNATGWTDWQTSGRDEHARGEAEYRAAQAQGYAEGARDRLGGRKDAVVGALSGDREQEAAGNVRRDKGQVRQDVNRPE